MVPNIEVELQTKLFQNYRRRMNEENLTFRQKFT